MKTKKDLGVDIHGFRLHNYNISLIVRYETPTGLVEKEALFSVITKDREDAEKAATRKAFETLKIFPYIKNVSVEVKKRKKKGE